MNSNVQAQIDWRDPRNDGIGLRLGVVEGPNFMLLAAKAYESFG
jgi:hypothetical protein